MMTAVEDGGLAFRLGDEDALDVARRIRDRLAATTDLTPDPATPQTILDVAGFRKIVQNEYFSPLPTPTPCES